MTVTVAAVMPLIVAVGHPEHAVALFGVPPTPGSRKQRTLLLAVVVFATTMYSRPAVEKSSHTSPLS